MKHLIKSAFAGRVMTSSSVHNSSFGWSRLAAIRSFSTINKDGYYSEDEVETKQR